jgi:hypothetical protein
MDLTGLGYSAMECLGEKECEQKCLIVWHRQSCQTEVYAFISVLGHLVCI